MKKLFSLLLYGAALTASAQTDVTATYLKNYGFDTGFHYKAGATNEVKQEIKPITGWTAGFTVDYTITGIYQFGFAGTYNAKSATRGKSQLGWIPQNGNPVISTLSSYPSKVWTLDQITFTLTETTIE